MDTQASSFYGHVILGFKTHFSYLSQPSISKTCSFINSCIHPSLFWAFEKIFTAFTLQVHTHFFFQKLVMISESLSKKSWKLILFKSMLAFQPKDIFCVLGNLFLFLLFFFCFCFFFRYFGTKLVERLDMIYVRVLIWPVVQG